MEEYYAVLKKMKDGPIEPTQIVKDEPEGDVTDFSAEIGVVDANLAEEDETAREEVATASPQTEAEQDAPGETRAPETPVSTKKRRIGALLEALYTTLSHMHAGGASPPTDVPAESSAAIAAEPEMATSGGDMDVDATEENINNVQTQPDAAEPQATTDVEMEGPDATEERDEPPTILPEETPQLEARPIKKTTSDKTSGDALATTKKVDFLTDDEDVSPLGKPRESKAKDMSNVQQLKNQVPQFMEYAAQTFQFRPHCHL